MLSANRDLTLAGAIVVTPAVFPPLGDRGTAEAVTDQQRTALGEHHLRRIDLADRVLVVDPGGYVGESTRREIEYARATGKPVAFTDPVQNRFVPRLDVVQGRREQPPATSPTRTC